MFLQEISVLSMEFLNGFFVLGLFLLELIDYLVGEVGVFIEAVFADELVEVFEVLGFLNKWDRIDQVC